MLYGREYEIELLNKSHKSKQSDLIAVYGRRRIGKSYLIKQYGKDKNFWSFEGLEGQPTPKQIEHFKEQLKSLTDDSLLDSIQFKNWSQVYDYLTNKIKAEDQKVVLFFDEIQWMAANQSKLIALIKYYWDKDWKDLNIQLILCGSIASFMVDKVIRSTALYGRIKLEILVTELQPYAVKQFFKDKRSLNEVLKYMLVFGGVPKYLELIDLKESFNKNIESLAFSRNGYIFNDYEKIFYSQFKEHTTYEKIVTLISKQPIELEKIAQNLKLKSGGGLKRYLTNLELARFIVGQKSISRENGKSTKYKLHDEYLRFYFKYIRQNRKLLLNQTTHSSSFFKNKIEPIWQPWLGHAFEHFCYKYNNVILKYLKIENEAIDIGPYFERNDQGFQIDLLIKRSDKVWNLCECKYSENLIDISVVKEVQNKIKKMKIPPGITIEPVLITVNGVEKSVEKIDYFHAILTIEDLFKHKP